MSRDEKVLLSVVLVWAATRLLSQLLWFVFAILLGVTLAPAVSLLERRGLTRAVAVAGFFALVLPPLAAQITVPAASDRACRARVESQLSTDYPFLKQVASRVLDLPSSPEVAVVGVVLLIVVVLMLAGRLQSAARIEAEVAHRDEYEMIEGETVLPRGSHARGSGRPPRAGR